MLPDISKKVERPIIVKMAGYLEKKDKMRVVGVRRWKKRWCVLEGKLLLYFKTQLEYSHHLSPCRGSVNMGLVLSVTPRGPCQLQIVTRSQIIIFRTKSKCEQDEWFVALRDAKNSDSCCAKPCRDRRTTLMEMHCRLSDRAMMQSNPNCDVINENHLRYGRSPRDSRGVGGAFYGKGHDGGGGVRRVTSARRSSAMRKSESDNRISFYREMHGLARTNASTTSPPPAIGEKEPCSRSRSLSYESIYFKPQEKAAPVKCEPVKSQSCRELVPNVTRRVSKKCSDKSISKRMSRSLSFFQKRREDSDSDDYDYIEIDGIKQKYSKPVTCSETSEKYPELPPRFVEKTDQDVASMSTDSQCGEYLNREANVDVIYVVNNERKVNAFEFESDAVLEYGTDQTVEADDDEPSSPPPPPPPLPVKRGSRQKVVPEEERHYSIADGVYVFQNGAEEVIYDVPIPHGKLIEQFRRLSVAHVSPTDRPEDSAIYDDSLEPSLYETLHMTPDSLELQATMFPPYKRWSNDSGFNYYDEPNSFSPGQTHYEDSLEPVIAMIHHDRKIWKNVPNINSTDYFR